MADKVLHLSSAAQLDELFASTTYVVIDFSAAWCGPCKAIAPFFEKLAAQHSLTNSLAFVKVDVDEARDIAQRYSITAMPTFLFFKEGKQVAVNGEAMIRGANPSTLAAAVVKLDGLAKAKAAASA